MGEGRYEHIPLQMWSSDVPYGPSLKGASVIDFQMLFFPILTIFCLRSVIIHIQVGNMTAIS